MLSVTDTVDRLDNFHTWLMSETIYPVTSWIKYLLITLVNRVITGWFSFILGPVNILLEGRVTSDEHSLTWREWMFRSGGFYFAQYLPIMMLNRWVPAPLKRFFFDTLSRLFSYMCTVPCLYVQGKSKDVRPEKGGQKFRAYWYTSSTRQTVKNINENTRILLHAHGGGFMAGHARQYARVFSMWVKQAAAKGEDLRIISLAYTLLEVQYGRPSPDQKVATQLCLDEATACYDYLTKQLGINSKNIQITGDSAGGNLALALSLVVRDTNRPAPCALVLYSPWTDVDPRLWPKDTECRDWFINYMAKTWFEWHQENYPDLHTHPYQSPVHDKLNDLPPMYIWYAEKELLGRAIHQFVLKAQEAGVVVTARRHKRLYHVAPIICDWIGADALQEMQNIISWVDAMFNAQHKQNKMDLSTQHRRAEIDHREEEQQPVLLQGQ